MNPFYARAGDLEVFVIAIAHNEKNQLVAVYIAKNRRIEWAPIAFFTFHEDGDAGASPPDWWFDKLRDEAA